MTDNKHIEADELDEVLNDLASTVEWCIDPQRLSGVYVDRDKATKAKTDAKVRLTTYIAERERLARIDELNSIQLEYGHYTAQTFINGQAMAIEDRLDSLNEKQA